MLKKFEKIIKGVINLTHKQTKKAQFSPDTGFYYVTDGYRVVRFADKINDLPLFEDGEKTYNCSRQYELVNEVEYDALEIPYTVEQIKAWRKENAKSKIPFKLGTFVRTSLSSLWIGINPKFLIEAMETTGSNILFIPQKGKQLIMQGNGFDWIIMPVALQGYESDKHMTEI